MCFGKVIVFLTSNGHFCYCRAQRVEGDFEKD
jgi:hypothetical protein